MQVVLGAIVIAATALIFIDRQLNRRGRRLLSTVPLSPRARRTVTILVFTLAGLTALPGIIPQLRVGIFAYCSVCPIGSVAEGGIHSPMDFVEILLVASWYYAATVIPVFLLAGLISGLLMTRWKRFTPRNVLSAFIIAAVLPVCSCGVIPVARAMLDKGERGIRTALVFLATAPLLSPVIIFLGLDILGPGYLLVRIAAAAVLACIVALVVAPHVVHTPTRNATAGSAGSGSEIGSPAMHAGSCAITASSPRSTDSVLEAARGTALSLLPYVLYGIVLGSVVAAAIPPEYVGAMIRSGILSLAASTLVGVPINMCAGEEILLISPLVGMGLPMGHALTFSLASTGICAGSLPLLTAIIGRKATLVMAAIYLVIPFLLGLALNLLPLGAAIGPQPF